MPTVHANTGITTLTDTTNVRLNISDVIDLLSPYDVPLLQRIGKASLKFPCDQITHEWLEDELMPQVYTLASAYTAGSGTMVLSSGEGNSVHVDDMLMCGDNVLRVLAISSDTLTVIGGVGDSTDASAAAASTVYRLSQAAPEGGVARLDTKKVAVTKPYNYTQIFKDWVVLTGTMEVISRYGYVSERAYQEAKKAKELAISMEKTMIYGVRSYSAGPPRLSTFGGLHHFVKLAGISGSWDTVVDAGGAEFTETMMNDMLQKIWEQGGQPSLIVVNGYNKRKMSSWITPRIRTDVETTRGGGIIATYTSDFGTLDIMLDRNLKASDVLFLTPEDIGFGPLNGRALQSRMLPSLGDYTQSEVLGEYTMEVHRASMAHGWLYDTATSG